MANALTRKIAKNEVLRFILSAGAGFVVDIGCYYLFYHNLFRQNTYKVLHYPVTNYVLSLGVSFFLGVLVNFLITRYFVFTQSKLKPSVQFIRFASVAFIGFFANIGMLKLFVQVLHLYPPVARICAALSLFFASFFIHKVFSFSLSLRHHAATNSAPGNRSI